MVPFEIENAFITKINRTNFLPSIIFSIEQKISADDGDADGNDCQYDNNQKRETIYVIDLVGPERCENKIPKPVEIVTISIFIALLVRCSV